MTVVGEGVGVVGEECGCGGRGVWVWWEKGVDVVGERCGCGRRRCGCGGEL